MKLFTDEFECNNLSDFLVIFLVLMSFICCFLNYVLGILKESLIDVFNPRNWVVCDFLNNKTPKKKILKGSA